MRKITPISHGKSWEDARRDPQMSAAPRSNWYIQHRHYEKRHWLILHLFGRNKWRMWPKKADNLQTSIENGNTVLREKCNRLDASKRRLDLCVAGIPELSGESSPTSFVIISPDIREHLPVAVDMAPRLVPAPEGTRLQPPDHRPVPLDYLRGRFKYLRASRPSCGPWWSRRERREDIRLHVRGAAALVDGKQRTSRCC